MLENITLSVGDSSLDANPDREPEGNLVERAVAGERPAFEVLYQKYYRRIYGLVFRVSI